jgi:hypothetical protein
MVRSFSKEISDRTKEEKIFQNLLKTKRRGHNVCVKAAGCSKTKYNAPKRTTNLFKMMVSLVHVAQTLIF